MNPNMWNIKEILSIPTGNSGAKPNNRNGATSDYSSLTDSQFVFGSQFWPENSQGMSQEMSYSSRTSQQSSQETSEPKISSNYHTKPLLFAGDSRDKSRMGTNVTSGNTISILDRFEEDRKKAKEKSESEIWAKEFQHFRETLNHMKLSISGTESNTMIFKSVLSEGLENFGKTLQQSLSTLQDGIVLQYETMLNKVSSQKQML
ncbi:interactor of HORMAD1 protein 1, partial [Aplochiton taeniatus]